MPTTSRRSARCSTWPISVTTEQFEAARAKLEDAGIDYLGPDRGADDSLYFRDPNGMGLELYREELGRFEGSDLL